MSFEIGLRTPPESRKRSGVGRGLALQELADGGALVSAGLGQGGARPRRVEPHLEQPAELRVLRTSGS